MSMTKEDILSQIRTLAENDAGSAPGMKRFASQTGIGKHQWYGVFWTRWTDAVREAGLTPNEKSKAYGDEFLLELMSKLTRRLARVPVDADLRMAARNDPGFPGHGSFARLGSKARLRTRMLTFCATKQGYEDVRKIWQDFSIRTQDDRHEVSPEQATQLGYVYLLKHGNRREYKIGRTYNPLRREGEVAIQLPEKLEPIHYIKTDDPAGIEAYWHARFADKRKEGEWFSLTADDVRAFKRWKRIY
jgi:hypothetical protein